MAVDVCATSSPRLSFSHDLQDQLSSDSTHPIRSDQLLLSPTFDFNFCTTSNLTPADELFSNGKILPTQIKKPQISQTHDPKTKLKHPNPDTHKKRLKEFIEDQDQVNEKSLTRSFWQFRRSASLNCDNGKGLNPKGLLRSLSIKSLARSNSTGSALNPKPSSGQKVVEKSKDSMFLRRCSSLNQPAPGSSSHVYYSYRNSNSKKNCREGIRIIPILNIPPAYNISKGTINFFGFGSLFCNGKVKKKTKS
ncbi:hypothetical protein L1987_10991 [Smallanthus sonchifolius]|uniref:Uncharacterized protein n=1 Tax=Smallanthus sonchifolius TaxID=185202 RepID=A0ACB9JAM6_9ASTR|nr:hypothetical protein L1987_10991 [Smallanthus sonchifolius]